MENIGIAVIGPVFVDIKGYPEGVYIPGGRNAGTVEVSHGGVSRNIAEDIVNIGLPSTFVSLVDDTGNGADVVSHLEKAGVNTEYIRSVKDGMGTWLAVFDETGDIKGAISKRPDIGFLNEILDEKGDEIISGCDSISVEIDMEDEILTRIFCLAEKYCKKIYAVVSNITIASEKRRFFDKTECFICNLDEAGILMHENFKGKNADELQKEAEKIRRKMGFSKMVITMGDEGAVFTSEDGECGFCPAHKVPVKDTTGAGDAFFAGTCAGLTYGKTFYEACALGSEMAARVVSTYDNVC